MDLWILCTTTSKNELGTLNRVKTSLNIFDCTTKKLQTFGNRKMSTPTYDFPLYLGGAGEAIPTLFDLDVKHQLLHNHHLPLCQRWSPTRNTIIPPED